jgi:hypothetical protein
MVVGMIGAALGVDRREHAAMQRLQDNIEVGWLVHREPHNVVDYQTTDLSRSHMVGPMWASDGQRVWVEGRRGGKETRTLVSERDLTCDLNITAVVEWRLDAPGADAVLAALDEPAMPLSIGARWALPTEPVAGIIIEAASLTDAVANARATMAALRVYLPIGHVAPGDASVVAVTASRDWRSRRHTGSALYAVSA